MIKLDRLLRLFTKIKLTHDEVIEYQHLIIEIEEAMKLADEINEGMEDIKQGRVVDDEVVRKTFESDLQCPLCDGILATSDTEHFILCNGIGQHEFTLNNKQNAEIVERLRKHISDLEANCGVSTPDKKQQEKINIWNLELKELQEIIGEEK